MHADELAKLEKASILTLGILMLSECMALRNRKTSCLDV